MPIVEAAAVSATSHHKGLSRMMEQAMGLALSECATEGVTDPAQIKERMHQYRVKAREEFLKVENEAARLIAGLPLPSIEDVVKSSRPKT